MAIPKSKAYSLNTADILTIIIMENIEKYKFCAYPGNHPEVIRKPFSFSPIWEEIPIS